MTVAKGFVVPAGGGKHFASPTPGRSFAMKLLGRETGESIMMFEETLPAGTASLYHLHRDSDEVAWVLAGQFTFKIGDQVAVGGPGTCAFMPRNVSHGSGDGQSFYRLGAVLARSGGGDPQPIDSANSWVRGRRLVSPAAAARSDGRSRAIGGR